MICQKFMRLPFVWRSLPSCIDRIIRQGRIQKFFEGEGLEIFLYELESLGGVKGFFFQKTIAN